MNPLDDLEFESLLATIKEDMPLHTENNFTIKQSFSQRFPKNIRDYSIKIDDKFLNDNLAVIEEINHIDSKHWIPKWFLDYQNKIYGGEDILNKDNFFKAKLHDSFFQYQNELGMPKNTKYYRSLSIQNVGYVGSLTNKINGADFESGSTASHTTGWSNQISGGKIPSMTANTWYDRLACNSFGAVGNQRLGCYDNAGGTGNTATNLLVETSSFTAATGFGWRSVTEFKVPDTVQWVVQNADSASLDNYYGNTTTRLAVNPKTYGAFPADVTVEAESYPDTSYIINHKMGHS